MKVKLYDAEVGLIQAIKLTWKAVRVYWRVCSSRYIMTKLHTKVLKSLIYHHKTSIMWVNECTNPVVSNWSSNPKNARHFVEHKVSEEALKTTDKYFKDYFDVINNDDNFKEGCNDTQNQT